MPRTVEADPAVAQRIRDAIERIEGDGPTSPKLKRRAARGTLKLSPTTVAEEAGIARHLIGAPGCLYSAEHEMIISRMPKRGEALPLRKQLDETRKELQAANQRLERSRTMCVHVLTRMHKQDLEVQRLQEELASREVEEKPLIGAGRVVTLPVRQSRKIEGGVRGRGA